MKTIAEDTMKLIPYSRNGWFKSCNDRDEYKAVSFNKKNVGGLFFVLNEKGEYELNNESGERWKSWKNTKDGMRIIKDKDEFDEII
ncbi:MAG TPA: hypothetical protein PLZ43_13730 [bacterium]|nr:hypothetical protein [bacterium]